MALTLGRWWRRFSNEVLRGMLPCTPQAFSPDQARGIPIRTSLFFAFAAMVSIGLAGAHVQPVLE